MDLIAGHLVFWSGFWLLKPAAAHADTRPPHNPENVSVTTSATNSYHYDMRGHSAVVAQCIYFFYTLIAMLHTFLPLHFIAYIANPNFTQCTALRFLAIQMIVVLMHPESMAVKRKHSG